MKKRNIFIFLLILGVIITASSFIFAQDNDYSNPDYDKIYEANSDIIELNKKIEENKTKIENLKKAANEYAQKIEEYKGQAVSLKNQLGLLDNQVIKIELDIKTTQLQIDKTKLEIEAMNYQIDKGENEIVSQKENLIEYVKQINKNDQKSYLEILILNDSFAEFYNQLKYLEEIQTDIQNAIERLKLLKDTVTVQKADTERQKQELEELKAKLEEQENKLKDDQKAKETILLETKSTEIQFQQLLTETKQRQNEIDTDILNLQEKIKDKIKQIRTEGTTPKTTLVDWPLNSHEITAFFHDPDYPFRYIFEHPAIDIRAKQGTQIKAPAPGYVARTVDAGYGYSYIIIIHDNGISTVYGHVSAIYVKEDTFVKTGDIIGLTGGMPGTRGAGRISLGPHLHFEVRLNGIPVNPLEYLP
jgi:murein DD-endopeptidase MepM/ murein hydrolase activator NlpD